MSLVVDIAWKHVTARLRQTLVATLGVATGVGFSIMMAALMQGSQDDFTKTLINSLPHVTITDEQRAVAPQPAAERYDIAAIRGLKPRDDRHGVKSPAAILAVLDNVPGVAAAAPYVATRGIIRAGGQDRSVSVLGLDWRRDALVSKLGEQMRVGAVQDLTGAANAIIIGSRLAAKLGATPGTRVNLIAATGGAVQAQVVGIFHAGVNAQDEGQVYTLIRTAQVLLGRTGYINEIRLKATDPLDARALGLAIEARLPYRAISWQEAQEDLLSAFQIRNMIMYTVVGAILLVASLGTYNIISTITHEKARDIAIMKSLGLPSAMVKRIFVLESFIIGLSGAVIGWGIGFALCLLLGLVEFKSPFGDATGLPIAYSTTHYVIATCVAVASSVAAGWLPSRKAAMVNPVEIIRGATWSAQAPIQMAEAAPVVVRTRGLTRILPGIVPVTLVRDIGIEVRRGEFVAVTGPSGSGKSSLLYLLGLLDEPTSGEVEIEGVSTASMDEEERARRRLISLGFVFQFHFLLPEFSLIENVALPMRALGKLPRSEMEARAAHLLQQLGLAGHEKKQPHQLSGGQRQRVAVARALANEPAVILADEPTGSLDSKSSAQVFSILESLAREQHKTVLIVTHDICYANRTDRRIHLIDGSLADAPAHMTG